MVGVVPDGYQIIQQNQSKRNSKVTGLHQIQDIKWDINLEKY